MVVLENKTKQDKTKQKQNKTFENGLWLILPKDKELNKMTMKNFY